MTRHTLATVGATVVTGWLLAVSTWVALTIAVDAINDEIRRGRA